MSLAKDRLCPEGRLSRSTKDNAGQQILDIESYIPYLLVAVNNSLTRGASQYYIKNFGIGIVEWRVLAMLAIEPGIRASRICEVISLDKAATSRALQQLKKKNYLKYNNDKSGKQRLDWWLNGRGYELHDQILKVALERERQLITGAEPKDIEAYLRVMRLMLNNVSEISNRMNS